ncbi:hypothetical protein [Ruegeria sp. HKCCA0370]|uniref:hypothetical protein n=1 Tax=Ruegeria sp. HKCCA0370 TaxID=2682995 RepID=UPI001488130E|nr:hypothetical protein [Ruegeria sp. HKCCA0370]
MEKQDYSKLDQEILVLAAVWDLIGAMVHYGHFFKDSDPNSTQLDRFTTSEAKDLFLVILSDFLAHPRDGTFCLKKPNVAGGMKDTHLAYLDRVVNNPSFGGDCGALADAIASFSNWLDGDAVIEDAHFPTIEWNGKFFVRRKDYLKICGNATKHGFMRLNRTVKQIKSIFARNGKVIDDGQSYIVIPDFIERFRDDVFLASAGRVAWHLNEIRWGIYDYLSYEFRRAHVLKKAVRGTQMYTYDTPPELSDPFIKSIYWDLMNEMRSPPFVPRFSADPILFDLY